MSQDMIKVYMGTVNVLQGMLKVSTDMIQVSQEMIKVYVNTVSVHQDMANIS
jgi:hypothetical protein